ncbi:hypothetical protein C8F01DRAFT_746380 [Mycena amicta]|nr:hypothetical protein C8F01DRAFT_746380 [Mycena amicta]
MPVPSLPEDILQEIISTTWHMPLSLDERRIFVCSSSLVNSLWAAMFEFAAGEVYIDSPASADHFLRHIMAPSRSRPLDSMPIVRRSTILSRIPILGPIVNFFNSHPCCHEDSTRAPPESAQRKPAIDHGNACRAITFELRATPISANAIQAGIDRPQERVTFPMGAVLDSFLEHIDAHLLLPNLRHLCLEYIDTTPHAFDDVFRRGLFALPPQIEHLEVWYTSSPVLRKELEDRRQRAFKWVARDVKRLTLRGATKGVVLDMRRVCPNARIWNVDGVCVRL